MKQEQQLKRRVELQVKRMRKAEHERPTLMAQTVYLGTLGLVFVLPIIGGAYLGRWLDSLMTGYSIQWTLSLLFLGLVIGAINMYLMIRE